MRVIIAGSRDILDAYALDEAITWAPFPISEVVSGGARGVDTMGELWARRNRIPVRHFFANWKEHGDRAGPIRNEAMACYAEALIALWDTRSKGTLDMIKRAGRHKLLLHVVEHLFNT